MISYELFSVECFGEGGVELTFVGEVLQPVGYAETAGNDDVHEAAVEGVAGVRDVFHLHAVERDALQHGDRPLALVVNHLR